MSRGDDDDQRDDSYLRLAGALNAADDCIHVVVEVRWVSVEKAFSTSEERVRVEVAVVVDGVSGCVRGGGGEHYMDQAMF